MLRIYKYLYFSIPRLNFLKNAHGISCLDFGCGDGVVLRQNMAVRPDLQYSCLDAKDFSKEMPDNVTFTLYGGGTLPYETNTFDIITTNHVFEHINNPVSVLLELKRVLKANGRIFIEVPNERSLWGKERSRFSGTVHFKDDPTHINPFTRKDLLNLCKDTDLVIVKYGISRNYIHLLLSPILVLLGLVMSDRLWYMYGRNSLIGWASFIILKK